MAKIESIVRRALRMINVIDARQPVQAVDMQTGIDALNAMMARFAATGLIEPWTVVDNPSDLFTLEAKDEDAIVANLAVRLAPEYETEPSQIVIGSAASGARSLWRDRIEPEPGATVGRIINRALRMLTGKGSEGFPDQFTLDGALEALNAMLGRWSASGLVEEWVPVTVPTAPYPMGLKDENAIASNLALLLAPEYGVEASKETIASASNGYRLLWRDRIAPKGVQGTVGAIIYRSLRLISGGETNAFPDAFSLDGAIQALNAMCQRWEANAIPMGWSPVVAVEDMLPAPMEAWDPITFNLAVMLAAEYGVSPPAHVVASAQSGLNDLRRDVYVVSPIRLNTNAPRGYSIYTGSYIE